MVQDLPTGLVPCKEFVFSRVALFGKEHNEFEWSLVDFKKSGIPIDVPQETQVVRQNDFNCEARWRRHEDQIDATEISVKPAATLQIIIDPEVLFQFFLFSKEGIYLICSKMFSS